MDINDTSQTDGGVYIAIDPGETCGWALFGTNGDAIIFGQFKMDKVVSWLQTECDTYKVLKVIIEDYRNFGHKQQKKWSRNDTSKIIGKIETVCEINKVSYCLQPPSVKAIGYKWAGLGKAPANHSISHQFDAVVHGVYWLQQNGIRPVGRAMQLANKEKTYDRP